MDITEFFIIGVIAYIATGIALTGYDFSAPALHRKMYVINQNYKTAMVIWFTWPISSMYEAYYEQKLGRSGFRFFYGVVLLAAGMFLWGKLAYTIADKLIGIVWIDAFLTFILLVLSSPILTAFAMPKHG